MSRSFSSAGRKIAPIREGGCLLLHPLNEKEPPANERLNLWLGVLLKPTSRVGQKLLQGGRAVHKSINASFTGGSGWERSGDESLRHAFRISILRASERFGAFFFRQAPIIIEKPVTNTHDKHCRARPFGARRRRDLNESAPNQVFQRRTIAGF